MYPKPIENLELSIPFKTLNRIYQTEKHWYALRLYLFYLTESKIQGSNKIPATSDFCVSQINGLSKNTIRKAKKSLLELGLIAEEPAHGATGKFYILLIGD